MSYDLSQPIGNRVASVDVICTYCSIPVYEPLDVEKVYKVVMQAYLIEGGDGYTMIKDNVISQKIGNVLNLCCNSTFKQASTYCYFGSLFLNRTTR